MIHKIIASLFLICLFIAIPLSLMGIERVELGEPFLSFMSTCNYELSNFKIEIPDIPTIPVFDDASGFSLVIDVLIKFVNIIIVIINTIADVINVVIQLIQFICIVVKNLITFKDSLVDYSIPVV